LDSVFFFSRLFVVFDKAKDYITKISSGIDEQIRLWQHRRGIILDQVKSTSSLDFLLPKTQRINELTIEAVQGYIKEKIFFCPKSSFCFFCSLMSG
jgi:hypothetical protein